MALQWSVEEKFMSMASPTETYRVNQDPNGRWMAMYTRSTVHGGASTTQMVIQDSDKLEDAIKACEEDYVVKLANPPEASEPVGLSSEQVIKKYRR
jgi:hypothetical protein